MIDFTKTDSVVLLSYVPLLYAPPQMVMQELQNNEATALAEYIDELQVQGSAIGCLWANHDGKASPVFIYDDAREIVEHLKGWTENEVTKWFRYRIREKNGKYLIALFPNFEKSVNRWRMNFQLVYGYPPPKDIKFNIFFKPLYFISGSDNMFDVIKDELNPEFRIGFIDRKNVDFENPERMAEIEDKIVHWLGPFKPLEGSFADSYFDAILDDTEEPDEPLGKSVVFDYGKELKKKKNREKRKRKK